MKLRTTFWSKEVYEFDRLLMVRRAEGPQEPFTAVLDTSLKDLAAARAFFLAAARLMRSEQVRNEYRREAAWYQFAVWRDEELCPIKWFDLVLDTGVVLSHDIAFNTTLIERNGLQVPFGRFPLNPLKTYRLYRELNIKARAYKYIANQISRK